MKLTLIGQNIIETSSSLFYKNGYSFKGINRARISRATLHNYFKYKEGICLAYLKFKNHTFLNDIEKSCTTKTQGKAQVLNLFEFLDFFYKNYVFNSHWCIKTISEFPKEIQNIRTEIQQQKKIFIKFVSDLFIDDYLSVLRMETKLLTQHIYLLYEVVISDVVNFFEHYENLLKKLYIQHCRR